MVPSSFSVPIPQDVLTLAERAVNRTGLFPDTKSLMSEAVMRMRVNLESKGRRSCQSGSGTTAAIPPGPATRHG